MPQSNVFSGPFSLTSQGVTDALGYTPLNRAGDTMLGDLKFTDATYDIGKTGATRPRDLFYSRTGQGGTLALGGATIGTHALAVTGSAAFAGLGAFSGTSTITYAAIEIENLSTANNTTKSVSYDFYGRDTVNTRKQVGRITVIPSDANWAGGGVGGIVFSPETSDGVVTETVRMPHAGGLLVNGLTAIPAGGAAGIGAMFSSTSNFGVFFGSGAPSLSAAKGSLYLRSDGSGVADRAYINTDSGTTWTALTTVA